jgi:DNA-binding PadR family transcriptional regulator
MTNKRLVAASSEPLILSLLTHEESYGYAIIARVRELSRGALEWNEGMLYPVLHRLERQGQIEARWGESDEGRRRKYYRATEAGRRAATSLRAEWLEVTAAIESFWGTDGASAGEALHGAA